MDRRTSPLTARDFASETERLNISAKAEGINLVLRPRAEDEMRRFRIHLIDVIILVKRGRVVKVEVSRGQQRFTVKHCSFDDRYLEAILELNERKKRVTVISCTAATLDAGEYDETA
jgi:hypothetical protein